MVSSALPDLPKEFETLDQFINYVNALLDISEDPEKLKSVPTKEIKDNIKLFLKLAKENMRKTLDFSKRQNELQAGSARYFASIAKSFNDYENTVNSILEKEALTEASLKKIQENFTGILDLLSEAGATENDREVLKGLKKKSIKAIIPLIKSGLKGLDTKVKKNIEKLLALIERLSSHLDKPIAGNEARVPIDRFLIDILLTAIMFVFVAKFLTIFVVYPFVEFLYEGSLKQSPLFFRFFYEIGFFPKPPLGHVTQDQMFGKTYYAVLVSILLLMIQWWRWHYMGKQVWPFKYFTKKK